MKLLLAVLTFSGYVVFASAPVTYDRIGRSIENLILACQTEESKQITQNAESARLIAENAAEISQLQGELKLAKNVASARARVPSQSPTVLRRQAAALAAQLQQTAVQPKQPQ